MIALANKEHWESGVMQLAVVYCCITSDPKNAVAPKDKGFPLLHFWESGFLEAASGVARTTVTWRNCIQRDGRGLDAAVGGTGELSSPLPGAFPILFVLVRGQLLVQGSNSEG